ncbi:MAG: hypothetical protein KAS32_01075 [Candidatus Peribacteraceae bacterium]|nr:hypothetical protein [Candidatus Peribacteraceae bacterium]
MDGMMRGKYSDNFRMARSGKLVEKADGTYGLIQLPKYAFISQIWVNVTQAYAGGTTGAATLGFAGNATTADVDGFMDATALGARAAGFKIMTDDAQPGSLGKWFSGGRGTITITLAKGDDTTLLIAEAFCHYSVIH